VTELLRWKKTDIHLFDIPAPDANANANTTTDQQVPSNRNRRGLDRTTTPGQGVPDQGDSNGTPDRWHALLAALPLRDAIDR